MENSFKSDYEKIIGHLETAKTAIESDANPEINLLTTKIKMDITKHINFLKVRIGESPDVETKPAVRPLKKIMGKVVLNDAGAPVSHNPIQTTPRDIEMQELKAKVEDMYGKFATTESDQLYDTLSDIEVRAVAKKAGLPVTDKTPKRIDITFINQIKDAIIKQHMSGRLVVNELNDKAPIEEEEDDFENALLNSINPVDPLQNLPLEPDGNFKMLNEISGLTNSAILEAYDENQIKEFAMMANVDVNDKTKIDSKFITQLKESIKTLNAGTNK